MQIVSIDRGRYGATGQAVSTRGRKYMFFAGTDGNAAVFRESGRFFHQIKPNTPRALSLAIRQAMRKAVRS